jgi:hypothetical protein
VLQVDSAALQTGFDGLTTANQQLTDDAVDNKACFDIQKASYDRLQVSGNCPESNSAASVTADSIVQVDSAALQTGFDGLTTANQQLTDDAVDNKASYDNQKASYDRLQVGACCLISHY